MSDFDAYKAEYVNGLYEGFIRKQVGDVKETQQYFIIEFLTLEGKTPFVGQGVVLPKDLGFIPQKGMKAIYDSDDSMGADGKVSFYNDDGKLLWGANRKQQKWSVVQKESEVSQLVSEKGNLMEIFQVRIDALKEVNPEKFVGGEKDALLVASSYAAQEWINRLNPSLGDKLTDKDRDIISEIHSKYKLDRGGNVNPFLVQDLVCSYLVDIKKGIIDKKGNLIGDVAKAEVMQVCHNSAENGLPANGTKTIHNANASVVARKRAIERASIKR